MALKKFKTEFKDYLKMVKPAFVKDLQQLLDKMEFQFKKGKSIKDMATLVFEYEFDYLDIMCWAADKNFNSISEILPLPSDTNVAKATKKSEWTGFFPEKTFIRFEKHIKKNKNKEFKIREKYDEFKYAAYQQWFASCWKKASKDRKKVAAFVSVHDSDFKTDLNTGKQMLEKDVKIRLLVKKK